MRHSIVFKGILLSLALGVLVGLGSQVLIIGTAAESGPLWQGRLVGGGIAAAALLAFILFAIRWQRRQAALNAGERRLFALAPRPDEAVASDFWRRAPAAYVARDRWDRPCDHVSLELGGDGREMLFMLSTPAALARPLRREVAREWAGTGIQALAMDGPAAGGDVARRGRGVWRWQTFTLAAPDFEPLKIHELRYGQPNPSSQLRGLLALVHEPPPGVVCGLQTLVRPAPASKAGGWRRRIGVQQRQLNNRGSHSTTRTQNGEAGSVRQSTSRHYAPADAMQKEAEIQRIMTRLEDGGLVEVCFRVWACGPDKKVVAQAVKEMGEAFIGVSSGDHNRLVAAHKGSDAEPVLGRHFPAGGGIVLTCRELGTLLHLPDAREVEGYARLRTAGAEPLAPEGRVALAGGTVLANDVANGTTVTNGAAAAAANGTMPTLSAATPVSVRHAGERVYGTHDSSGGERVRIGHAFADTTKHTFIVGATGTGKSVLGANLVLQDWLSGHAALVIDPHRSLIDDILRGVPPAREKDVILLDPHDRLQPFRFNPFGVAGSPETVTERLMNAIRTAMGASWHTSVGMQEVLANLISLALHAPEPAAMTTLAALLADDVRNKALAAMTAQTPAARQTRHFWQVQFPAMNKADRARALGAARRRIDNFTRRSLVRRTLGMAGSTVDLAAALNSGKLVVCPMHQEMGPDTKRIWSALLLQEVYHALLSRRPNSSLPRVTVAIDELAESAGALAETITALLNEGRKYGAALLLLNQSYVGLDEELRQVIINNCRTQVALSQGIDDARVAAQVIGAGVTPEDFQALEPFQAYARLAVSGGQAAPCLLHTLPPLTAVGNPAPRPMPQPPDGIPALKAPLPDRLDADLTIPELLTWARRVRPGQTEAAGALLAVLTALPAERYEALWALKQESDAWWAAQVLAEPGIVGSKVGRIRYLSRLRFGIPWWRSDADYLRMSDASGGSGAARRRVPL